MRRNNMNNNQMQGRAGPLMTDHLQDLELELELLKRKRQLIQRQQSSMLYDRPGGSLGGGLGGSLLDDVRYNQPSQSYNDRFNEPQHLNFSHLYNDNPRNNQAFGLKRQAQSDWSGSPGNNMGGQKRSRPNPFVQPFQNNTQQNFQRPGFMPQPLLSTPKPKPLMNFPVQGNRPPNRPNKQQQGPKPLTHHPNFKQNKSANRPGGPANRPGGPANRPGGPANRPGGPANRPGGPANRPAGPANRAAGFANRPTGPANRPAGPVNRPAGPVNANRPGFVPKNDVSPKKSFPPKTKNVFMAGKRPNNKMNGRLELALGMIVKEIKVTYENKPEYKGVFSFAPFARLMKQGIRERLHSAMVGKVVEKASDIIAEYRQKFPLATDKEIVDLAVIEQKKDNQKLEIAITLLEEGDPEQYFKINMTKLLQVRFDEMMGKLTKMITDENEVTTAEILGHLPDIKKEPHFGTAASKAEKTAENESGKGDTDNAETTQANGETAAPNAETAAPNAETAAPNAETAAPNAETAAHNAETAPEKAAEETQTSDETAKADGETPAKENDNSPLDISFKESKYDQWLSLYLQRKLPGLLNRHRSNVLKVFDLDKMFTNTRAAIIINANNKAQAMKAGQKNNNEQGKDDPELPRNLPYFAKVLAVPSMPKRKIMQDFLNQFNPKTIKRHKKNYNLLFIGFDSKENYDKILAANQTTLANATLSIMGNVTKTTADQSDADIDQVLTPQLDDQINDLLNSIRKADEEAQGNDDSVADIDLTHEESQETSNIEETNETENSANPVATEETNETATIETSENPEVIEGNGDATDAANGTDNTSDDIEVIESSEDNVVTIEDDEVAPLKSDVKNPAPATPATPAKGRAPVTPRSVNTRRSSRLQN